MRFRRCTWKNEPKESVMGLFMDVHTVEGGVAASDVASAHDQDLAVQGAHGANSSYAACCTEPRWATKGTVRRRRC
jgi:hypothetical protein